MSDTQNDELDREPLGVDEPGEMLPEGEAEARMMQRTRDFPDSQMVTETTPTGDDDPAIKPPARPRESRSQSRRRKLQEPPRPRNGAVMFCPYHDVQLKAGKSENVFTRYYCPEAGCKYSQKVARPDAQRIYSRDAGQRAQDQSAR